MTKTEELIYPICINMAAIFNNFVEITNTSSVESGLSYAGDASAYPGAIQNEDVETVL